MLRVTPLKIPELIVLETTVHTDERGFFQESWSRKHFAEAIGSDPEFVQDNHSRSVRGVVRALHYQLPPQPQAKLVRVARGVVWDVAVDLRKNSPTFKQWAAVELSAENHLQLWIPEGFAHGYLVLSDVAEVMYKLTGYYSAELDRAVRWNDLDIGIDWPLVSDPILSDKDREAPLLRDAEVFG